MQDELARELGVSRTPLIATLKRLESERLVENVPRRGVYVRTFSTMEMLEIFEIREALEGIAARDAAKSITDEQIERLRSFFKNVTTSSDEKNLKAYAEADLKFHRFLAEISGNRILIEILATFHILAFSHQRGLIRPPSETLSEHMAIIDALAKRDGKLAEKLTRNHLILSQKRLAAKLEEEGKEGREVISNLGNTLG